jgi:hypothetical protein
VRKLICCDSHRIHIVVSMAELWYRAALIQAQLTAHSRSVLPGAVHCQAMRDYSRAWDYLLIAMILLTALAWIWFPMAMTIWIATSFIMFRACVAFSCAER